MITPRLLARGEAVAALRERIQAAAVELSWIPALQKDTRTRNVHASTAIEGNPLTLEQVRALEEGRELVASDQRSQREVLNYFAGQQGRLGYAVRLRRGQAIGSGLVEGTIKQRVNVRKKRSGARWLPEHVGPFVELLALADTPEGDELWASMAA